jgi:hypothetical protein
MDSLMLLKVVREVSLLADPDEPTAVSQRSFDSARERSPDYTCPPRAKRIAERLRLSWPDVLTVAHAPDAEQNRLLGLRTRAARADWLGGDPVAAVRPALRVVALRRGVETLTLAEYRAERNVILSADRARWMHGGALRLPTDEQIIAVAGSWDAALRLAGLRALRERDTTERRSDAAPSLVDLLARFHNAHDFQPSARDLRAFARGNGIPYPRHVQQGFSVAVTEWRRQRQEQGLPKPRVVTRKGGRGRKAPDYSANIGAARAGEKRRGQWKRYDCVAAVSRYLAQLRSAERSTERGYRDWAAAQPHGTTPAFATVQEHGGWEAMRRDAIARNERDREWPA